MFVKLKARHPESVSRRTKDLQFAFGIKVHEQMQILRCRSG